MRIDKFFRTYQEFFVSGALIVIVIVGTIFGIFPMIQKILSIREDSVALSDSVQKLQSKETILENINDQTYQTELAALVSAVPTDKSLPTLFSTIDAVSASTGVIVAELSLDRPGTLASGSADKQTAEEKKIGTSLIPFSISVKGNYLQIHDFIAQVINIRRFFRVRNFNISFRDPDNITVRLGMDAFYAPLESIATTIESPIDPFSADETHIITTIENMRQPGALSSTISEPTAQSESTRSDPFSLQ